MPHNSQAEILSDCDTVRAEAIPGEPSKGYEAMARRRFQNPKPFQEGQFWWLRVWNTNPAGSRKRQRIRLAPASMPVREVQKIAEEKLRPMNQGLAHGPEFLFGD